MRIFVPRDAAALAAAIDGMRARGRAVVLVSHRVQAIGKADMPENDAIVDIRVDPDTFAVHVDGELITEAPAEVLPMAQRYFLF